jgi:ferric-dicitrate binding protein FerR (iron transport regulator)
VPEIDPLMHEALEWVVLLKSGETTIADAKALQRWLRKSRSHEDAFAAAVRLWRALGAVAQELVKEAHPASPKRPRPALRLGCYALLDSPADYSVRDGRRLSGARTIM